MVVVMGRIIAVLILASSLLAAIARAQTPGSGERPVEPRLRYPAIGEAAENIGLAQQRIEESTDSVPLYLVFEEMIEEAIAELQDADVGEISPIAVRSVRASPQLSAWYVGQVQQQLTAQIIEHTAHQIRHCITCESLRSRVEDGDWVITLGVANHRELQQEAELLGVQSFMDIRLGYFPEQNVASLAIEIFTPARGTIQWARSYRSDATTAAILRTGDRMETRAERVEELERRLDSRPSVMHQPSIGAGFIQISGPEQFVFGAMLGYRLFEQFGGDRRWLFSLGGEGFFNFDTAAPLIGGFINAALQYELLPPNLNDFSLRTGPALGAFLAGSEGNSFVAEWGIDGVFQFLLGAGISIFYFVPTPLGDQDLGGFGGKARFTVTFR